MELVELGFYGAFQVFLVYGLKCECPDPFERPAVLV